MLISYDVRGIYPDEINESTVKFFAKKFYNFLKRKKIHPQIFLAIDQRNSSINLASAFCDSYISYGKGSIEYLGILPVPIFYYYCLKNQKAGVMVTASHLPSRFNGLKFFLPNGESWIYKGKIPSKIKSKRVSKVRYKNVVFENIYEEYIFDIKKFYKLKDNHYLNANEKDTFVNYFLFKSLEKIEKKIKIKTNSNLKVMSDFDGDRLWVIYKNETILAEQILYAILKLGYYKKIGVPLNISKKILETFKGLNFVFIPTGHSNFKKAFKKYKLDFAFEPTFHYYFFKEIKTESPLIGFLRFLEYIERFGFEEILKNKFYVKRFEVKNRLDIERISDLLKKDGFRVKKFDGFNFTKYNNKDYFVVHIRKSKTEKNVFRLFLEASSESGLRFLQKLIIKIIKNGNN